LAATKKSNCAGSLTVIAIAISIVGQDEL
jgi:hypothetical protein